MQPLVFYIMKRNKKISPGQLNIFCQIIYAGVAYESLKAAMIAAMQDFYIFQKYPEKIIAFGKSYNLKAMKDFWRKHELQDVYH